MVAGSTAGRAGGHGAGLAHAPHTGVVSIHGCRTTSARRARRQSRGVSMWGSGGGGEPAAAGRRGRVHVHVHEHGRALSSIGPASVLRQGIRLGLGVGSPPIPPLVLASSYLYRPTLAPATDRALPGGCCRAGTTCSARLTHITRQAGHSITLDSRSHEAPCPQTHLSSCRHAPPSPSSSLTHHTLGTGRHVLRPRLLLPGDAAPSAAVNASRVSACPTRGWRSGPGVQDAHRCRGRGDYQIPAPTMRQTL